MSRRPITMKPFLFLILFASAALCHALPEQGLMLDLDASKMTVGQERDAIQHPGHESFDGEIARLLIWERPLNYKELTAAMSELQAAYLAERFQINLLRKAFSK
jgi:hypothetical protein